MKYAILVGDGMADFPIVELGNKTPLEYAATPNMDFIAAHGKVGLVSTVPDGMPPGSDVANLSLLGYDPALYYSGRAPIEAASLGVALTPRDTAFRCNFVTLGGGTMIDYSAGHIDTASASQLITALQKKLDSSSVHFYPGVSYRHLLVIADFPDNLVCTPPHDISGQDFAPHLPAGPGADQILTLMKQANAILSGAKLNRIRLLEGRRAATDIWLWGQGHAVTLPALRDRFGISGSVISAVDLVRGLGVLAGMSVRIVKGATGYLGTNYAGKIEAAQTALAEQDFIYLHVEAPDETSHEGSLEKKIQAIEEFDKNIVGEILRIQKDLADLRIIVAPDHATPVSTRTHAAGPVPYAVCGPGIACDTASSYSERSCRGMPVITGPQLIESFTKGTL